MNRISRVTNIAVYRVTRFMFPNSAVQKAWQHACKFWSIFGFSRPRINRSILDTNRPEDSSLAYLNFLEKRITVNLHHLSILGVLDLLSSIFVHEVGHKFIPGTLKVLLQLVHAVKMVIKDENAAKHVENMFTDMIVNTDAHRRGDRGMHEFYARIWKDKPDPVQQIVGRAYERLFQRSDTTRAYAQTIIRVKPSAEIETAADRVMDIILNARRSNWLRSAREFAEILKPFIPEMDCAGRTYVVSNRGPENFSPEGKCPIPPKGKGDIKDLQKRLGGMVFDLKQLEGEEKGKPCSEGEFRRFLENNKIDVTEEEARIWYYRDVISGKVVKVPEVSAYSGALFPFAPTTWRFSDPIHELDIALSASVSGHPFIAPKKWIMKGGKHLKVGKDYPDLDLWIDSSSSMENPAAVLSRAVTSGMIVAKSFIETKKAVRVINWSATDGEPLFKSTDGFIRDEDEVDKTIIKYFGGATILPMDEIEKPYLAEGGKQKYIVLITDMGIQNMDDSVISRLQRVFDRSVGGTVFLIGEGKGDVREILEEIGFDVVEVKDISDLDDHALKLTKKLFEERAEIL